MRAGSLRQAQWFQHVNAVNAPSGLRRWLAGGGSLTAKLKAHSLAFRVERLHQETAICLPDEAAAIGLHRPGRVWEREVLLKCDERAVVFAHTVVPMAATAADWPLFSALGNRSLGSTLFGDPQVRRGVLEYARIRSGHPLMRRASLALGLDGHEETILYARRCLYRRHQGVLLVTEVFLPALGNLVRLEKARINAGDRLTNRIN
ncbi:MAG TPA: chorismate lyase [Janthinobacterium sp.]|nr:chorismate lyase [Janthinobacterium sp.]